MLVETVRSCYAAAMRPKALPTSLPSLDDVSLVTGDYLVREHGENALEVWCPDISEHYLITLNLDRQPIIDVVLITAETAN